MASAGSRALPKMAAGSRARARGRTESRGPAVPGRRRPPARGAKGSSEGGRPAATSAQPAGQVPARRQQRGGLRTPSLSSSCEVAVGRPSKRLKREEPGLEKSEPEGLTVGSGSLAALGETPEASCGDPRSEDPDDSNIIQQRKGGGTLETNEDNLEKEVNVSLKPGAVKSSSAPSKTDSDDDSLHSHIGSEEESSCESVLSDGGLTKEAVQPDNSAFLDEDSNQPMPVDRFFGDCKFIEDPPAVVLPSTTMSRREFRKLHFIAKEEEEEEEDGV